MVAHPGFREEIEPAGILWIANQRRVKADLRPKRRAVEREDVAGALAADDRETPAEVAHEAALVAVRPPHAHRAVVRRARTAVRAGEVERQPSAGNHHVLRGVGHMTVHDVHAPDHRVANRQRGLEHDVMEDPAGRGAGYRRRSRIEDGRDLRLVFARGRHKRWGDRDRARSRWPREILRDHGPVHLDRHPSRLRQRERQRHAGLAHLPVDAVDLSEEVNVLNGQQLRRQMERDALHGRVRRLVDEVDRRVALEREQLRGLRRHADRRRRARHGPGVLAVRKVEHRLAHD